MERSIEPQPTTRQRRVLFRKQLVIPAEHGSWSWLLVPYLVGILVAGSWNLATLLVLIGGLAGFLLRQPATAWMRIRAGRGRRADEPLARWWSVALAAIALLCLAGLLLLGRGMLLWLILPMMAIFAFYLLASRQRRAGTRTLWMEIAGAAGLAAMAPSAYIAAAGQLDGTAWVLWGLMASQNALGVLYVRVRIADSHDREVDRSSILWSHTAILALLIVAAFSGLIPWLATVPFLGFLLRAAWTAIRPRPIGNIKRFGFSEVGVELVGGLLIAAGFLLW